MITNLENKLFAEWKKRNKNFSADGVVNASLYTASCKKLLFILKETNKAGEDFDLRAFLAKGERPHSWDNVTRWVMGIRSLDTDIKWSDIESIDQKQRKKHLSTIAVINMKKETGGHTTDTKAFWATAKRDKDLIKRQIDLYKADYIILCGSIVAKGFKLACSYSSEERWPETSRGIPYIEYAKGKFAISYSHPEARVHAPLLHYGLIDAIREIEILRTQNRRMK